jgi:hypothetical protein
MLNNTIIPFLIIIFSLLIIFYILNIKKKNLYKTNVKKFINYTEKFDSHHISDNIIKNKWIILLTTCVNPHLQTNYFKKKNNEINYRKKLYVEQINKWISKTNLFIYVVDSSGYEYPEIKENKDKIKIISFNLNKDICNNSSECEINSIKYAINQINLDEKYINSTHILKVTGRYFLENIDNVLDKTILDLYLQYHRNDDIKFQNTEYFGIKKDLINEFIEKYNSTEVIEKHIYIYSLNKKYTMIGKFPNNIRRGGDNLLIKEL